MYGLGKTANKPKLFTEICKMPTWNFMWTLNENYYGKGTNQIYTRKNEILKQKWEDSPRGHEKLREISSEQKVLSSEND